MKRLIVSLIALLTIASAGYGRTLRGVDEKVNDIRKGRNNNNQIQTLRVSGSVVLPIGSLDSADIEDASVTLADVSVAGISGSAGGTQWASKTTLVSYMGAVHHDVLTFVMSGASDDLDLADGADHGTGQAIITFPEGRILILGAAINATITSSANFEVSDTDHFVVSIGTATAADDATLTSTEADIIASTDFDTAAGATVTHEWEADMVSGADTVFDGSASAIILYVNAATLNDHVSGANTFKFAGTLTVSYVVLGDD